MKLNTDMGEWIKSRKPVYPTKRTMNLYFKSDRTTTPATRTLYVLFALLAVLSLSKVLFYDPWNTVRKMQEQLSSLEVQTSNQMEQLKDYNTILEDYIRSTPTQMESVQTDSMEILDLVDQIIRPKARISRVSIEKDTVLVTFSGISLGEATQLIAGLEESGLVQKINIDTVVSSQGYGNETEIQVYFEIASGEENQK